MKASHAHRDPSTYRGGGADPAKLSQIRRREWERRTPEEKASHLAHFIVAGQKAARRASRTRIEMIVRDLLLQLGAEIEQNVQLGPYNVDFIAGRKIVECLGDYWHCNPAVWKPSQVNLSLHMTAAEKWAKDAARKAKLENAGYDVLMLWESDIRGRTHWVYERLVDWWNRCNESTTP